MDNAPTLREVVHVARMVLGGASAALHWLDTPCLALGGKRPLDVALSDDGKRRILTLLHQLEHGVIP